MQINLLPWRQQKRAKNKRAFYILALTVLVSVFAFLLTTHSILATRYHQLAQKSLSFAIIEEKLELQLVPIKENNEQLTPYLKRWQNLTDLLFQLPTVLPENFVLTKLELSDQIIQIHARTDTHQKMLRGLADLDQLNMIASSQLMSSQPKEGQVDFILAFEMESLDGAR